MERFLFEVGMEGLCGWVCCGALNAFVSSDADIAYRLITPVIHRKRIGTHHNSTCMHMISPPFKHYSIPILNPTSSITRNTFLLSLKICTQHLFRRHPILGPLLTRRQLPLRLSLFKRFAQHTDRTVPCS
jgi:hypothetical protein